MTICSAAALLLAMVLLAAMPSVSVLAVSSRAAAGGFPAGAMTALGIVVADLLFILLALLGLSLLAAALGDSLWLLRYLAVAYLGWLALGLWRAPAKTTEGPPALQRGSFATGFLLTLADQKAVLFYFGFLPAFLDPLTASHHDVLLVMAIAVVGVGGVKLAYAWAAARLGQVLPPAAGAILNRAAAVAILLAAATLLLAA